MPARSSRPSGPPPVRVRLAEDADALGVAALHLQHERELGAPPRAGYLDELADAWRRGRERRRTWVAVQPDGRPVGLAHGDLVPGLPGLDRPARAWLHLDLVFVSADRRGEGVGERLVRGVVGWARRERLARVELTAVPAARDLFARVGFADAPRAMALTLDA